MRTFTTDPESHGDHVPRTETVTDAVVAAYIHEISDRHRVAASRDRLRARLTTEPRRPRLGFVTRTPR
jgi:hypothetical protein